MRAQLNENPQIVEEIKAKLKANDGYCPCKLIHNKDTKCMCKDFRENIQPGEYCHCGLYKKIER